jgi:hypothetical protein
MKKRLSAEGDTKKDISILQYFMLGVAIKLRLPENGSDIMDVKAYQCRPGQRSVAD